jgi:D-serine deaminase-like pyridoxal phosphate-dependent protein
VASAERYDEIFADLEPPFAFIDFDAIRANAAKLLAAAAPKPIRIASKSVRSRELLARLLALDPGFQGLLTSATASATSSSPIPALSARPWRSWPGSRVRRPPRCR